MTYGQIEGLPAVAKLLGPRDGPWRWYFERELAVYRAFERDAWPVRVPRLYAADVDEGVMVLERIEGEVLCETRAARRAIDGTILRALLDGLERFATIAIDDPRLPTLEPTAAERAALRARLLEDPSAPIAWVREGLVASARRGLLPDALARAAIAAIDDHPRARTSHGDLLLRNVMTVRDGRDPLAWIDLECVGPHAEGWDLALLWVNVCDEDRPAIEARVEQLGDDRARRAWTACALFACARERLYRRRHPGHGADDGADARGRRLSRDVAELEGRMLR